jgi:AcrR family transcriptional regulator
MLHTVAQLPPALSKGPVEPGRISRETQSEQQRVRVLGSLTKVFAKRGYQAATVDHLIAGAKISMGGFYNHFEGKEDCFVQVYDRVVTDVEERIRAAVPADADWSGQVAAGLHALLKFAFDEPLAARVALLEAQTGGREAVRRYNANLKAVAKLLRRGRSEGTCGKQLPSSFEDATTSGLVWMLQSRIARSELDELEPLFEEMAKVALEPYLGQVEARRVLAGVALD